MKFTPGNRVKFKNPVHEKYWFLTESIGVVTNSRQFGPVETMVTARFGDRTLHTSSVNLILLEATED